MNRFAIIFSLSVSAVSVMAQNSAEPDTITTMELQEVIVQAPKVLHKADMDLYFPSRSAVDNSANGVQLLNNLMIPSLTVTDALGSVKAAGESVQLRINGREATLEQVRALMPSLVKRVEWIDNPGLRYNGANYVVNFIVANPTVGGSVQTQIRQAVNEAFGEYFATAKFNTGASQFEVGGQFKLTDDIKIYRNYQETFTFPDGSSESRYETPLGGHVKNNLGRFWASYNYIKPDTTIFFLEASVTPTFSDDQTFEGLVSFSSGKDRLNLTDSRGNHGTTPKISAYLEQHLNKNQILAFNFNGSFYFGRTFSDYIERNPDYLRPLTDVHTLIKDRNQAYSFEANYLKNWSNARFTAGASYTANRNRSVYENLADAVFHQRQDKVYLFSEYFRRLGKATFTIGLGAQYTNFLFKETGQGNHSWNMRPQATVTYALNHSHQFKLSFESWQSTPSLLESNIAPQQIDGFQWRIGNPNLQTSNSYMLTLRYNFYLPRIAGLFGIRAFTSPDAITPLLYWQADKLITTYENSSGLQNLSFFIAPQIEIIPDWLMASGYLQYKVEKMRGTGYKLYNHNWSGNVNLMLSHWGFVLSGQYVRAQHDLWGERISWGENLSVIELSYFKNNWQFGAGMIMPFGRYDQGSRMLSRWNTNIQHTRTDMRAVYLTIGYNLQWGHQKRNAQKLINNGVETDRSSAAGR